MIVWDDDEDGSEIDAWCVDLAWRFLSCQVVGNRMYDVVVLAERIRAALDNFISTGFTDREYEQAPACVKRFVARHWEHMG